MSRTQNLPCDKELPDCNPTEIIAQEAAIDIILAEMRGLVLSDLSFPTKLRLILLCNGTQTYILEEYRTDIPHDYEILQTIDLTSPDQTFPITLGEAAQKDLFALELNYHEGGGYAEPLKAGDPQHNGNIVTMRWQVKGNAAEGYGYEYDALNRLKRAHYETQTVGGWSEENIYGVPTINYDPIGNITQLTRNGLIKKEGC